MKLPLLSFLIIICFALQMHAQCTSTITTFPYFEDFETSNGGWVSGGIGNDWAWGTPTKTVISAAGSGSKCWIAGTLNTIGYNLGEKSYITSPCFNFTNVAKPYVVFKVFWETEKQFDGATFQYSLNAGTTWNNVGTNTDPVDCLNQNWFNSGNISGLTNLTPAAAKHGWAGNIQPTVGVCLGGDGLGQWVVAKHCMANLAGEPSVMFRFAFGAGTNCNAYEGFAVDSFVLGNAPSAPSNVIANCQGNNAFAFSATNPLCYTSYQWNFGDTASGTNNTATGINANHTYSIPGTYTVQVIASGICAKADTTYTVIYAPSLGVTIGALCNAVNAIGVAAVSSIPAGTTFTYSWNTLPVQNTASVTNLMPGAYTVTATQNNGCTNTLAVTVTLPSAISFQTSIVNTFCNGQGTGSINTIVSGGVGPYTYSWTPNVGNTPSISGLNAGTYTLVATDSRGCTSSIGIVLSAPNIISLSTSSNDANCGQPTGSASVIVSGGVPPYNYLWSNGNVMPNLSNVLSGTYTCVVSDANNCTQSASVAIGQGTTFNANYVSKNDTCYSGIGEIILQNTNGNAPYTFTFNGNSVASGLFNNLVAGTYTIQVQDGVGCFFDTIITIANFDLYTKPDLGADQTICITSVILDAGIFKQYAWNDGSTERTLKVTEPGLYYVKVANQYGCTAGDTILVKDNCTETLYFPNAFSPNSDGINDAFTGQTSKPTNLESYNLKIFNRWGEMVFQSRNLDYKFIGVYKGLDLPTGTYYYSCAYKFIGQNENVLNGDLILLR
jgi:gliding motility-associated-like protein